MSFIAFSELGLLDKLYLSFSWRLIFWKYKSERFWNLHYLFIMCNMKCSYFHPNSSLVTVTHSLQATTRPPGARHDLRSPSTRVRDRYQEANIAFVLIVAKSPGGWHPRNIGPAGEANQMPGPSHCVKLTQTRCWRPAATCVAIIIVCGLLEMVLNRTPFPSGIPTHPAFDEVSHNPVIPVQLGGIDF